MFQASRIATWWTVRWNFVRKSSAWVLAGACASSLWIGCGPTSADVLRLVAPNMGYPVQPSVEYTTSIGIDLESLPTGVPLRGELEIGETNADFNHALETVTLFIESMVPRSFAFATDNGEIDRSLAVSIPLLSDDLRQLLADGRLDIRVRTSPYVNQSQGMQNEATSPSFLSARLLVEIIPEPAMSLSLLLAMLVSFRYFAASRGIRIA